MHWLKRLKDGRGLSNRVFSLTANRFLEKVRRYAQVNEISECHRIGTHAFRRGMAQDIVSAGGSLALLLKAGDWHSKAFFTYLRQSQPEDEAVAQMVINVSDSEEEG